MLKYTIVYLLLFKKIFLLHLLFVYAAFDHVGLRDSTQVGSGKHLYLLNHLDSLYLIVFDTGPSLWTLHRILPLSYYTSLMSVAPLCPGNTPFMFLTPTVPPNASVSKQQHQTSEVISELHLTH